MRSRMRYFLSLPFLYAVFVVKRKQFNALFQTYLTNFPAFPRSVFSFSLILVLTIIFQLLPLFPASLPAGEVRSGWRRHHSDLEAHQASQPNFNKQIEEFPPLVWFVHGMIMVRDEFNLEMEYLWKIFPNASAVTMKRWAAPRGPDLSLEMHWDRSVVEAEKFAKKLALEIESLSERDRERLVLVGHSLGGRIAVRALASFFRRNHLQIRQCVLAGAAMDFNDPDLTEAVFASSLPVCSLINPRDVMMNAYRIADHRTGLGTGCLFPMDENEFYEIALVDTNTHFGYEYLRRLFECIQNDDFSNPEVIVPQVIPPIYFPKFGGRWTTLDEFLGWKLQKHSATGLCRILDHEENLTVGGRGPEVKLAFARVRQQLTEQEKFQPPTDNWVFSNSKPRVNFSSAGSAAWWIDVEEFKGWRVQKSRATAKWRLLDPESRKRVFGGEYEVREAFQFVKNRIEISHE